MACSAPATRCGRAPAKTGVSLSGKCLGTQAGRLIRDCDALDRRGLRCDLAQEFCSRPRVERTTDKMPFAGGKAGKGRRQRRGPVGVMRAIDPDRLFCSNLVSRPSARR